MTAINRPDVHAEVMACVMLYERALTTNDVDLLDELFWPSPHTIRYGPGEVLYGHAEILAFRQQRDARNLARKIRRLEITTFGEDFATANLEFQRAGDQRIGRQSQAWVRFAPGWRVVSAHVSLMAESTLATTASERHHGEPD